MEGTERDRGRDLHERPRHVVQSALAEDPKPSRALTEAERAGIGQQAQRSGFAAAAAAAAVSGAAVLTANATSARFRGALGISGKMALVVTPTAGAFFLRSQQTVNRANLDAERYLSDPNAPSAAPARTSLAVWQLAANAVYDHPMKSIIGTAV